MLHMNAARIRFLMRKHGWTIAGLARHAGVTQDRIRQLRNGGVRRPDPARAYFDVTAWYELLTGRVIFNRQRYDRLRA